MEADADGIGAAVAADGRVDDVDDDVEALAKFLFQQPFSFSSDIGAVAVADGHAVGLHVLAEVFNILHQARNGFGTARFLADGDHLTVVV